MVTRWRRNNAYTIFLLIEGVYAFLFTMYATLSSVYRVETVQLNPFQLVLLGTALEATILVFQLPTGIFADVLSRRISIIAGVILTGLGILLEGSLPIFATVLLAQAIWGLGYTFISGAEEAWIADEVGEAQAGRAYLRGAQIAQLAGLLGALVSVALGSVRLNLPMLVSGVAFLAFAVALLFLMPEQHRRLASADEELRTTRQALRETFHNGLAVLHLRPALLVILSIGAIYGMSSEGYDRLAPAHLLLDLHLPPLGQFPPIAWFGAFSVGGTLLSLAATELVRRRLDLTSHLSVARILIIANGLLAASIIIFGLVGNFPLAVAAYLSVYTLRAVHAPIYTAWLNQRIDSRIRATVLSMGGQADALGQIVGGPIIGIIGTLVSIRAALTATGALLTPALALYASALRRRERTLIEHKATEIEAPANLER